MSKITTRSVFYFGTKVTTLNRAIDFTEDGGPEVQATMDVGDYSLTEYAAEIQRVMRIAGTQAYVVTVDRVTRFITISGPDFDFELLTNSGSRVGTSIWTMAGFSTAADYTGSDTYTGSAGAGFEYQTQYPVEKYVSEADSNVRENATRNTTPLGITQAIHFGKGSRIEMDIRLITNLIGLKNEPFYDNVNGVQDARDFMDYVIDGNRLEFMPDVADRSSFVKVTIESTEADRSGLEFRLKNSKTPEFYNTGRLVFRKVLI